MDALIERTLTKAHPNYKKNDKLEKNKKLLVSSKLYINILLIFDSFN